MSQEFDLYKHYFIMAMRSMNTEVIQGSNDIKCKCPICGDSKKGNKQRLHLYMKDNVINVNCFNGDCPVKSLHPANFLKTYFYSLYQDYLDYKRSLRLNQLVNNLDDWKVVEFKTDSQETKNYEPILNLFKSFTMNKYKDFNLIKDFLKDIDNQRLFKEFLNDNTTKE